MSAAAGRPSASAKAGVRESSTSSTGAIVLRSIVPVAEVLPPEMRSTDSSVKTRRSMLRSTSVPVSSCVTVHVPSPFSVTVWLARTSPYTAESMIASSVSWSMTARLIDRSARSRLRLKTRPWKSTMDSNRSVPGPLR